MIRRMAVLWLTMAALLWQPLALAQPSLPAQPSSSASSAGEGLTHALLHWLDLGHHHHADGGVHLDDSAEARAHAATDPLSQPSLHLGGVDAVLTLPREATPRTPVARAVGPPFLEGPLRPPRLNA